MAKRTFSPHELNHLRKYGFGEADLSPFGEMPVEYITGHAEFRNLDFIVSKDTLIPRLESEMIVQTALAHIREFDLAHPFIADIGTGSGCIGISLAADLTGEQRPYSIFLSDISPGALTIARGNAGRLLSSPANLFFEQSDLFKSFPNIKFDVITANLPYIPSSRILSLDSSVRDFEPVSALDGGSDGTDVIDEFLKQLPLFLSGRGLAILEIDDTHTLKDFSIPQSLEANLKQDFLGKDRFLIISRKQ